MNKRCIAMAVSFFLLINTADASAKSKTFDTVALAAYVKNSEAYYVTEWWQRDDWLSDWLWETSFPEYAWDFEWKAGSTGDMSLSLGMSGAAEYGFPILILKGSSAIALELDTITIKAFSVSYVFPFDEIDERIVVNEETQDEYDFTITCCMGEEGMMLLNSLRKSGGALELTLSQRGGNTAYIHQPALPPWEETEDAERTAFDLFYDGLIAAHYVNEQGVLGDDVYGFLLILKDLGITCQINMKPDGQLQLGDVQTV